MKPKINIVEFADRINKDDFIDTIIQFIDKNKFQPDVCVRTLDFNISKPDFPKESRFKLIPGEGKLNIIRTAFRLSRLLRKWQTDILHVHHFDQVIIGWLATRLYSKTILVIGRHYSDSLYRMPKGLKQKIFFWLERKSHKAAIKIIVPSEFIRSILISRQHVPDSKVEVIYYGLNPAKYKKISADQILQLRSDLDLIQKYVIVCVGRLHEEKGHKYLIKAAIELSKRYSDLRILFIGEGPERKALEGEIYLNNLQNIISITGWRRDVIDLIQIADVVIQPTLQEAFSQVMCEAMYLGRPLIITDVSGSRDLIQTGYNGLIINKESFSDIVSAVDYLRSNSDIPVKMGLNASLTIKEMLPLDKIIGEYEKMFTDLVSAKMCNE